MFRFSEYFHIFSDSEVVKCMIGKSPTYLDLAARVAEGLRRTKSTLGFLESEKLGKVE